MTAKITAANQKAIIGREAPRGEKSQGRNSENSINRDEYRMQGRFDDKQKFRRHSGQLASQQNHVSRNQFPHKMKRLLGWVNVNTHMARP